MSPEQCRAARGWLDMSQRKLAKLAELSESTVRDFEKGRRMPTPESLQALKSTFEKRGIVFRFRNSEPVAIEITEVS